MKAVRYRSDMNYLFEEFDLVSCDISELSIKENAEKSTCYVVSKDHKSYYTSFILDKNSRSLLKCEISFYRSSINDRYIPRLTFKRCNLDGVEQDSSKQSIRISFSDGPVAIRFWKFINFLGAFKDLVDTGDFQKEFKVVTDDYAEILKKLESPEKMKAVKRLLNIIKLTPHEVNSLVYETRKKDVRLFLWLLRNKPLKGSNSREYYKEFHNLNGGDEAVWHHFLKENSWILGLNADLRFISDFVDEAKVGIEDSSGKSSPKVDMLGVSQYTTLVELKTPETMIFKKEKGARSRTNTWEFSSDFISGISQCLAQKSALDESYTVKRFLDADRKVISKDKVYNKDVKSIFIVGCRYEQFPHNLENDNLIKSETFELFRRNNRNVDLITYDELFERAYHMVCLEKIPEGWYGDEKFDVK